MISHRCPFECKKKKAPVNEWLEHAGEKALRNGQPGMNDEGSFTRSVSSSDGFLSSFVQQKEDTAFALTEFWEELVIAQ